MHQNPAQLPESMFELYNRPLCVVTGGSSGIGLATAMTFASKGFNLLICGRSEDRLKTAMEKILNAGDGSCICLTRVLDLAEPGNALEFAKTALTFGRVDVLVNNAGVAPLAPLEEVSEAELDQSLNVNIRSVFRLTQAIWPVMKEQGRGVIVNISSLAAIDPFPGFSLYGASKAWVDTFTIALGNEGKELGIQTYSIRPGAVETPLLRGLFPDFPAEQTVSPQEIADKIWQCVSQPEKFESGKAYMVTNQPS